MRHRATEAAELLAAEGVAAEVVDPRTIVPLDLATITASVAKTNRLICVQECSPTGSWGASVIAALVAESFELLDAPPIMVGGDETPIPYSGVLEGAWLPSAERIAQAARETLAY
jgi:pyruvate dehydrogenase E1 component beta subunit